MSNKADGAGRVSEPPTKKAKTSEDAGTGEGEADQSNEGVDGLALAQSLPGELRNRVWDDHLGVIPGLTKTVSSRLELDSANNTVHVIADKRKRTEYLDLVRNGSTKLFNTSLVESPATFREFFSNVSTNIIFSFVTPESLERFALLLGYIMSANQGHSFKIRISVEWFRSPGQADSFKDMQKRPRQNWMAHGYEQNAYDHVKDWVRCNICVISR